jgi:hypothetical protein
MDDLDGDRLVQALELGDLLLQQVFEAGVLLAVDLDVSFRLGAGRAGRTTTGRSDERDGEHSKRKKPARRRFEHDPYRSSLDTPTRTLTRRRFERDYAVFADSLADGLCPSRLLDSNRCLTVGRRLPNLAES